MTASLRILVEFTWPNDWVTRLWDGAGPFVDADLNVWRGTELSGGLDEIEQAINGEAYTLSVSMTGVPSTIGDLMWNAYEEGSIIGGKIRVMLLPCDENDQQLGEPEIRFSGAVDNVVFDDKAEDEQSNANIVVECTNRFSLRRLRAGSVLSDADQRARAAILNPDGEPDRFCERVSLMADKVIVWPRWN